MADCPSLRNRSLRLSYRIARGEQGVLTFEPYKSHLVALWRFRTPAIARESSSKLWSEFLRYNEAGDFVGMDMTRKFIQMGMTRAKRYANYKGGKKYERVKGVKGEEGRVRNENGKGKQKEKSMSHEGQAEKLEASNVFKEVWERCRVHKGYLQKKEVFLKEQKEWDKEMKGQVTRDRFTGQIRINKDNVKEEGDGFVKIEQYDSSSELSAEPTRLTTKRTRASTRVKKEIDDDDDG